MKKIKEKLNRHINLLVDKTLRKEVDNNFATLGDVLSNPNLNQHVLYGETSFSEICHIKPKNPKFQRGTLLVSPEGVRPFDDPMHFSVGKCMDEFPDYSINIGDQKQIEDLGEVKKYLVSEVVMVIDETIQIKKNTRIHVQQNQKHENFIAEKFYFVEHILHLLSNKKKIFLSTNMFKEDPSNYKKFLEMKETLDMKLIEEIYKSSEPKEIIYPLTIQKPAETTK